MALPIHEHGYLEVILGPMFSGKSTFLEKIYRKYVLCNVPTLVINHSCDATRYVAADLQDIEINVNTDVNTNTDENKSDKNTEIEPFTNYMITHDKHGIPCTYISSLFSIPSETIDKYPVILINEGQFFAELDIYVKELLVKNKIIYVCGLDGDYKRAKFGQILELIPLCDKVSKLDAVCGICRRPDKSAIFTIRLNPKERDQVLVGGAETYKPACRECYNKSMSLC